MDHFKAWGWARDNLLPIELTALRDRASHLQGQAKVTVSGEGPRGPWRVMLVTASGRSLPARMYSGHVYDAACAGLAILEDHARLAEAGAAS